MKKALLSSLLLLAAALPTQAGVTLSLTIGELDKFDGTPLSENSLLQLIISTTDSSFAAPLPGAFVSGDDFIVKSFGLDSSTTGVAGAFSTVISFDLGVNNITAGDQILLRWYDAPASSVTATAGMRYGQIRFDNATADGSAAWTVPSDGGTIDLVFLSAKAGGSSSDTLGVASSVVIPEPSTYAAILGGLTLGVVALRRRAKK